MNMKTYRRHGDINDEKHNIKPILLVEIDSTWSLSSRHNTIHSELHVENAKNKVTNQVDEFRSKEDGKHEFYTLVLTTDRSIVNFQLSKILI